MEWRPICAAPRDGRWFIGAWFQDDDDFGYVTSTVRYAGCNNWQEKEWADGCIPVSEPTHWMPLPNPPQANTPAASCDLHDAHGTDPEMIKRELARAKEVSK